MNISQNYGKRKMGKVTWRIVKDTIFKVNDHQLMMIRKFMEMNLYLKRNGKEILQRMLQEIVIKI